MKNMMASVFLAFSLFGCSNQVDYENGDDLKMKEIERLLDKCVKNRKPLPPLAKRTKKITVKIVIFGSNFPLESEGNVDKVFVRFENEGFTLFMIVPDGYTENGIRRSLIDEDAPPVFVNSFELVK